MREIHLVVLAPERHVVDTHHFAAGLVDVAAGRAVRDMRPDIVVADQIPASRVAVLGKPVDRGLELPRRRLADHEETGRPLSAFIDRRVNVWQSAAQSAHQGDAHRADMHADHRLGAVFRNQVEGVLGHQFGIRARVGEHKLDLAAKNAAGGIHFLRRQHRARLA
jgi:hypothetical protein